MSERDSTQLSSERLALLYELSQTFNSSLDLEEVLNRVMDEVIEALNAERGFVMLREDDGTLVFRAARGLDQRRIDDPAFQISRGVVEEVAQEGTPILTSDAQRDPRFSSRQSVMSLKLRSILCAPLQIKDQVTGVVYVDNRLQAGIFTQADLELLNAIASSAAIAIENARLYQIALEKTRMERELQMARKVQISLLPPEVPQLPGWELAAHWSPAREVSGDYYDFIPHGDDCLGLLIADVTDKGLPAALYMVFSRNIIRDAVRRSDSPAELINLANQRICRESTQGLYVTLAYALLDHVQGHITYVNAGHNPGFLYQTAQDRLDMLTPTGMPVGIDEHVNYQERNLELQSGDFILFYTDGITDAINQEGHEFGDDRLRKVVFDHRQDSAEALLTAVKTAVTDFTDNAPQFDDTTLVIVKRVTTQL